MNKQRLALMTAAWVLGLAATGMAAIFTTADNFNDGVRNKAFWKPYGNGTAQFREQQGKLFYSTTTQGDAFARWDWKTAYMLIGEDRLDILFTLQMPLDLSVSGQTLLFGVGFRDVSWPNRYVGFHMIQHDVSRWFRVEKANGVVGSTTSYGPKKAPETIKLRLRYNNTNKTVSFAYRDAAGDWQIAASDLNLNTYWGSSASRHLQPYVFARSAGAHFEPDTFSIDDFTVVNKVWDIP